MVVHIDKLKPCGETPNSWLTGLDVEPEEPRLNDEAREPMPGEATLFDEPLTRDKDRTATPAAEEVPAEQADMRESRPTRNRRPPKRLNDYAW
jgi:hypothetical protein